MRAHAFAAAIVAAAAVDPGLVDHPIAAASHTSLDGTWTARAVVAGATVSVPATVPGDLVTDLQAAGLVGDPLYELNFLNASLWSAHTWTFTTTFAAPAHDDGQRQPPPASLLVFDGVKMGSRILLDGKQIGNTTDQFLRYVFPVTHAIGTAGTRHTLEVVFDRAIDCSGRWMACTGGWDWAPYTNTAQGGIPTFTRGIWKSVSLVQVASVAIVDVVPQISYAGEYPVAPLTDDSHGGFHVAVRVHTWAARPYKCTVTIVGGWEGGTLSQAVLLPAGNASTTFTLPTAHAVQLWWAAGHGSQPLYNLSVTFTPAGASSAAANATTVSTHRRVGFRFFALVTGNDTDPAYVAASKGKDGTASLGMMWRLNGAAILCDSILY